MSNFNSDIKEEHRLRVFENRVLRKVFEPKETKLQEAGQSCIKRSFIACTLLQV
jgi:hypothetical protein